MRKQELVSNNYVSWVLYVKFLIEKHCLVKPGRNLLPYILLNEIQTLFSQLAKRSSGVLPADLCTDHAQINGFEKEQKHGGGSQDCFSPFFFLVIRKFQFQFQSIVLP